MSVRIRHAESGFYYAGPRRWVSDARQARDLRTIDGAIVEVRRAEFRGINVVACVGNNENEWMLALRSGADEIEEILHSDSWRAPQPEVHHPSAAREQNP